MAGITTYDELLHELETKSERPDLAHRMGEFVWLAELRLQQELQMRPVEKETTGTLTGGQDYLSCPADFLEAQHLRLDLDPIRYCTIVSPTKFDDIRQSSTDQHPLVMRLWGSKILLAPTPAANDAYTLFYKGGVTHLTEDAPTGLLLTIAANALLAGAMLELKLEIEDWLGVDKWTEVFARSATAVKLGEWRRKAGGGPLTIKPDMIA